MRHATALSLLLCFASQFASAQKPPLLPEHQVAALAQEMSGEIAKRNLEGITRFHRQRGSQGFHSAAELIAERARGYGLSGIAILELPADGKIYYGTQRSRPAWEAEFAELWEMKRGPSGSAPANAAGESWLPAVKLAFFEAEPVFLAEDSESADVTAELIDVGDGTKESDYAGKEVIGKIVLAAAQPGAIQDLAVGKFGAAGIVSYAQNQLTAWWGEDDNLIRWGHLDTFSANKTFAFMVSLKTARSLRKRIAQGEHIELHASVKAGQHPGNYEIVTAVIPGADPKLKEEEIAFSCHLDHQRPGANDNASGCVTILEVARTLQKLIAADILPRPARTIRFIWPPEIEGTLALLNGKPEFAARIKAVVHMDMVGGGQATKAVFHVTRGPMSLPSFVHDVAWAFGDFVNDQSYRFAAGLPATFPLVALEGGKEPLLAQDTAYTMGSDHDVYQDGSFRIPAIYLNDWPDRYIHTNFDAAANIDPTKLKRAAFIGAASGYFLAGFTASDSQAVANVNALLAHGTDLRKLTLSSRSSSLPPQLASCIDGFNQEYNRELQSDLAAFLSTAPRRLEKSSPSSRAVCADEMEASTTGNLKFRRKPEPRGPVLVFGSDFVRDRIAAAGAATPRILSYQGLWGDGESYAYEILNFADGSLDARQIRDRVSIEYGPVSLDYVLEYLRALESAGIVEPIR